MSKKKKIAIFHCGFIYSGGGERIVLEEARGLKKRGYEVVVYAPTLDKAKCFPEFLKEVEVKTFLPTFIDWLPLRNALRMVASSLLAPFFAMRFRDVDVFIGANQPGAWMAYCIARVLNKPYIVYLNQPNRLLYPRPVDKEFGWYTTVKDYQFLFKLIQPIRPLISIPDRVSITHADKVLVNGDYIGDIIENIYGKSVVEAPAGSHLYPKGYLLLSSKGIYSGSTKIKERIIKKPYLLITNRHDPQKRFDYVISALEIILRKHKKAKLVIPGLFTDHTKILIKQAKKLGIENKIYWLGQITEQELQGLYKNCCVYCYPSPEEDFGLGPLEAGGWGIPTVAWNHAGPTITVEDGVTGFLAKPYDIVDYAGKIVKLLENPSLRTKLGKAAWERTKNIFSWKNHINALEEIILKLV